MMWRDPEAAPRPRRRDLALAFLFIVLFVLACSLVPGGGLPQ